MKKYLFIALAALCLVACNKNKPTYLKAESERLYANIEAAYEQELTSDEIGYLIECTVDTLYMLLEENMGEPYSDSLFLAIHQHFPLEKQETLFNLMPEEMKQEPEMKAAYEAFQARKASSVGSKYIDITGVTSDGGELSLSELVGQTDYVLVDFWATWCGPCRRLMPVLQDLYNRFGGERLEILSCSLDQDKAAWMQFLFETRYPWQQIREDETHPCADKYGVQYIPFTVLIDRNGQIVAINPEEPEIEEILLDGEIIAAE